MLKIIKEVGLRRIFKYFIFSLWQLIFDLLLFSPLRIWWLRFGGATIGKNCFIDKIDFINLGRTGLSGLKIGDECFLGRGVVLDLAGEILIEKQVVIALRTIILTHFSAGFSDHPLLTRYKKFVKKVILKKACFIGAGSIILPGVKLGEESLVAAGAVVTKSIPSKSLVAGVPAKIKNK